MPFLKFLLRPASCSQDGGRRVAQPSPCTQAQAVPCERHSQHATLRAHAHGPGRSRWRLAGSQAGAVRCVVGNKSLTAMILHRSWSGQPQPKLARDACFSHLCRRSAQALQSPFVIDSKEPADVMQGAPRPWKARNDRAKGVRLRRPAPAQAQVMRWSIIPC